MASILRTPIIARDKRKLTRRNSAEEISRASAHADSSNDSVGEAGDQKLQALLENARLSVLAQIKSEAESAREIGRQRGLLEGRQAGREEMQQAMSSEVARLHAISHEIESALETGIRNLEDIALAIAFEAVCKVLGSHALEQDVVQAQVLHAMSSVIANERIQVRLHPSDLAALRQFGALTATLPSGKQISWMGDAKLQLGGCILETNGGDLDARFETQLDRFKQTLLETREKQKRDDEILK